MLIRMHIFLYRIFYHFQVYSSFELKKGDKNAYQVVNLLMCVKDIFKCDL